ARLPLANSRGGQAVHSLSSKNPTTKSNVTHGLTSQTSRVSGSDTALVIVDRSGLSTGTYEGTIDIVSNGGDRTVVVEMEVPISNQAPDIAITPIEAEQRDTVEIEFTLDDVEGDSLLLNVLYSFDESMSETFPAALEEELLPLGPEDYQGTLHWLTTEDLPDQEVDIYLLVEAADSFSVNGYMLPVHVDNYPGNVLIEPLLGEVEGDAEISYTIEDPWSDTFSLTPQFLSPATGEWTAANVTGQTDGIGPEAYAGTLTWHTAEDFPSYEDPVTFRIQPHDGLGYGTSDEVSIDVDNLGPPQVLSYSPAADSLAYWMSLELEVTFSRSIDPATVDGAVSISGEISSVHPFTYNYDEASRVLTISTVGVFASLETVTFTITPDLTDLDGIPFDGNGNGDVDDPSEDTFTGAFIITLLGDYTLNGMVNTADFSLFREAWLNPENFPERDIGPALGEIPQLQPVMDSTIDFEDLMVFAQMWNWSYQSGNYDDSTGVLARIAAETPVQIVRRESSDNGWLPVTEQRFWLDVYVENFVERGLFEFTLDVDPSAVSFEGIANNLEEPWTVLHFFDEESGRLTVAGAVLAPNHQLSGEEPILAVEFRKRVESETVMDIGTALWSLAGEATNYPESQYRLNLKPPLPEKAVLHQNFPNPFNPVTTIRYELPDEGHVRLSVVNILGQQIATLFSGQQEAGFHEITWAGRDAYGRNVATGIYFFVLETKERTLHRKMLLIK
ncbi:MAG: Ig-like domain-containing protein, partial [Fidelibacterota bacterium]